jgi:hypothetical protein
MLVRERTCEVRWQVRSCRNAILSLLQQVSVEYIISTRESSKGREALTHVLAEVPHLLTHICAV